MKEPREINGANEPLSERELEILRLVATGASNNQIARELFISPNTVKVHLRNIFAKLGVESRMEATMVAIREGWVTVPQEAVESAPQPEAPPPIPLPRAKRLFLVIAALLVALGTLAAWPRAASPGPMNCPDAFSDCLTPTPTVVGSPSRWRARAQMPAPRSRLALVAVDRKLYAIGGKTIEGVTGAVDIYDPSTNTWAPGARKPTAAANIGAAAVGTLIYVPGGFGADGQPMDILEVYDTTADRWLSRAHLPTRLGAYAIAALEDRLYLFGGWDGTRYVPNTYVYDARRDAWEARRPMPTARGFAAAGAIAGRIYVVGGYDNTKEYATCEAYDPATDTWASCAPMAEARGGIGAGVIQDRLYVVGGGWTGYLSFNERYDPTTDSWARFETPLTFQWRNLGVAALEGDLYAAGGWSGEPLGVLQTYQALFKLFLPATGK